jgi:hypothetical protein
VWADAAKRASRCHPAFRGRAHEAVRRGASDAGAVTAFGDLPREPLSDHYGLDRGTPVDRRYIEGFLSARRGVIHGAVLEVHDDTYTTRFGEDRVSRSIVVDIDATNPNATLIADLQLAGALPPDSYDCIILTQTLHLLRRPGVCVANCFAALRPGGGLLATAPSVSRVSPTRRVGAHSAVLAIRGGGVEVVKGGRGSRGCRGWRARRSGRRLG